MVRFNNIYALFLDDSHFSRICKQQITNLTLVINENKIEIDEEDYTKNVYAPVLAVFENLKCLSIMPSSIDNCPLFSLWFTPEKVFSSSTLTKLCINVHDFNDCLLLLDGQLKQLTALIVQVHLITDEISVLHKRVSFRSVLVYIS